MDPRIACDKESLLRRSGMKLYGTVCCFLFFIFACDIPTALPILEQRWVLPLDQATIGVEQLLPAGVTMNDGALKVTVDTLLTSSSLDSLCAECIGLDGSTAVIPAFTSSFNGSSNLPANISDVEVSSGSVQVALTNGLSFDPLAGGGSVQVTLTNGQGGSQLAQVDFNGAIISGSSLTQSSSINSSRVNTTIFASVEVISPGGQVAPVDVSEQLTVAVTDIALIISSGIVNLESHQVEIDPIQLDLEHIGSEVTEKIVNGSLILDVVNPFGVSLTGNINIGPTSKGFSISESGVSTTAVSYTGNELRSFIGQKGVTLSLFGTADGSSVTVRPGQELTIEVKIDCVIRTD